MLNVLCVLLLSAVLGYVQGSYLFCEVKLDIYKCLDVSDLQARPYRRAIRRLGKYHDHYFKEGTDTVEYTIEVRIADEDGAGTDDELDVVLYGTGGDTESHNLDIWYRDDFEKGSTQSYDFDDVVDVGDITCVRLKARGSNSVLVDQIKVGKKQGEKVTLVNEEKVWLSTASRKNTSKLIKFCVPCEAGYYKSADICKPCPLSRYTDTAGQTDCVLCEAGKQTWEEGSTECVECEAGYYNSVAGGTCLPCGGDTESRSTGNVHCAENPTPSTKQSAEIPSEVVDESDQTEPPQVMEGLLTGGNRVLTVMVCQKVHFKDCKPVSLSPYRPRYQVPGNETVRSILVVDYQGQGEPLNILSSSGNEYQVRAPFYDHDLSDGIGDLALTLEAEGGVIASVGYGKDVGAYLGERCNYENDYDQHEWEQLTYGLPTYPDSTSLQKLFIATECRSTLVRRPELLVSFLTLDNEPKGMLNMTLGTFGSLSYSSFRDGETKNDTYIFDSSEVRCAGNDLIYEVEVVEGGIGVKCQGVTLLEPTSWSPSREAMQMFQAGSVLVDIIYDNQTLSESGGHPETSWIAVEPFPELGWRDKHNDTVSCTLETSSLQLKTNTSFSSTDSSSQDKIQVLLYTAEEEEAGSIVIWPLTGVLYIPACSEAGDTMSGKHPEENNTKPEGVTTWSITKSNISITVAYNDVEVYNLVFADVDSGRFPECVRKLSKAVTKVLLANDTATTAYRCRSEALPPTPGTTEELTTVDTDIAGRGVTLFTIKPAKSTTEEGTQTPFNITESDEAVQAMLNNTIKLKTKVTEPPGDNETVEESVAVWKPQFKGAIPVDEVEKKSKEYSENRVSDNLLGYLTYNGYTEFGINKVEVGESPPAADAHVDERVVLEAVRSFQRFNGFPETGELTPKQVEATNNSKRCGNKDVDYNQQKHTFLCKGGQYEGREGTEIDSKVPCPNHDDKFKNCIIMPSSLELDEYRKFVHNENYFFEADIHFLTRERYEHVALAFNYNKKSATADYIYFKYFRQRMCFSYGTYKHGLRHHTGSPRKCVYPDKEQKILDQYKLRVDISRTRAYVTVNNRDMFDFEPANPPKSSAFLFTLDGVYYRNNKLRMITSRICRRRQTDSSSRGKRFALSEHKWAARQIQYAFVNYSTSLGSELTRTEILRAIDVYSSSANLAFQEVQPVQANKYADITFMFIRGRHFDGLSFLGAGAEKAHAYAPVHGEIHFNDYEVYSTEKGKGTANLFYVSLHEIGHTLGLSHSELHDAVMHKDYSEDKAYSFNSFHYDDIHAISAQYEGTIFLSASSGAHTHLQDRVLEENKEYVPKFPFPKECHNKIEAAFHYYPRKEKPGDSHSYFLFTNGFLWKYGEVGGPALAGYPRRVSEVFSGVEGKVDAAFDTGKLIYIITRNSVYEYQLLHGSIIGRTNTTTLSAMFGIPDSTEVWSAFNHYKRDKDKTVKTTLVASRTTHYQITWSRAGKIRTSTERVDHATDLIGEELPATRFRAAFEWDRELASGETRFEVMEFDSQRTARSKVVYPGGNYTKRTGSFDTPTVFSIHGWCRKDN